MNHQPPLSETDSTFAIREIPFVLTSIVGFGVFIFSIAPTVQEGVATHAHEGLNRLLEMSFTQVRQELPPRALLALGFAAILSWLPPLAGVALLLVIWLKLLPPLTSIEPTAVKWNLWDVFKVWASSFCFFAVLALVVSKSLHTVAPQSDVTIFGVNAAGRAIVMVALCSYAAHARGGRLFLTGGISLRKTIRNLLHGLKGFLLTAPFCFGTAQLSGLLAKMVGREKGFDRITLYLLDTPVSQVLILLASVAVLVPLAEEVLFRGLFYPALEHRAGRRTAIVLSAVIFAALHLSPYDFLPLFVIGIGLAYTYSRTRSIGACFAFHAANNSVSAVSALLLRIAVR